MAGVTRKEDSAPTLLETFGWPWLEHNRAFAQRFLGLRDDMVRIEELVDGHTYVIRAELPGIDPDKDVEITMAGGYVSVRARRQREKREESGSGYRTEFQYGLFYRSVPLPSGTKEEEITARYADGILEIRVPMAARERETERRIAVTRD